MKPWTGAQVLVALGILLGCPAVTPSVAKPAQGATASKQPELRVGSGTLSSEYYARHPDQPESAPGGRQSVGESQTFGFTEIALERTMCFGACPVYVAVVRADGRVAYWGDSDVKHHGERHGRIDTSAFAYLARLANELGIDQLKDRYRVPVTDQPSVYVGLTRRGRRKIISHYAPEYSGPARLQAFEHEIDRVIAQTEWD